MRYYVTTDIHGFYTPLITALTKAGFFADSAPHKLVILGDLFDRGKEALKLQAFLSALLDQDQVILIRGNHEDLFEELVTIDTGLPYPPCRQWHLRYRSSTHRFRSSPRPYFAR